MHVAGRGVPAPSLTSPEQLIPWAPGESDIAAKYGEDTDAFDSPFPVL
jgi:hypothetical protein